MAACWACRCVSSAGGARVPSRFRPCHRLRRAHSRRSKPGCCCCPANGWKPRPDAIRWCVAFWGVAWGMPTPSSRACRSEEHTSELQSLRHLVCRLLLEKKKVTFKITIEGLSDGYASDEHTRSPDS